MTEDSFKEFLRGLNISALHLPCEPSNPKRLKGLDYAEFEDLDSLFTALSLNEEFLGNRIRVGVADQTQDEDRGARSFGQDRNWDSSKPDTEFRAHPATDSFEDYPPRRHDDSFGDKYGDSYASDQYCDGYWDSYRDGPCRDMGQYRGWITMMTETVETTIEAMIPGQAVAEEHLVMDSAGMMTTEEEGASMETGMTDMMIGHGVPEMFIRRDDRGPSRRPNFKSKASEHFYGR